MFSLNTSGTHSKEVCIHNKLWDAERAHVSSSADVPDDWSDKPAAGYTSHAPGEIQYTHTNLFYPTMFCPNSSWAAIDIHNGGLLGVNQLSIIFFSLPLDRAVQSDTPKMLVKETKFRNTFPVLKASAVNWMTTRDDFSCSRFSTWSLLSPAFFSSERWFNSALQHPSAATQYNRMHFRSTTLAGKAVPTG